MSQPLNVVLRIAMLSCFVVFEWPVWFYDFEVHVAPRCHQLPVSTILQSKLASGYNSGSRLAAHPNGRFDQGLVALFAAT